MAKSSNKTKQRAVDKPTIDTLNKQDASLPANSSSPKKERQGPDPRSGAFSLDMNETTKFKERKRQQEAERIKTVEKLRQHKENKLQQHRKKKLLAGCEQVMNVQYDVLAMDNYPDNTQIAQARRERDYWVLLAVVSFMVIVLGLMGFANAWVTGSAFGMLFLSGALIFSPIRSVFISKPTIGQLLNKRKVLEFQALGHVRLLEGPNGLAWRCSRLSKYNSNLDNKLFNGLYRFSEAKNIIDFLIERKHIRLYLLLMVEAEKAYKRLQEDYLKHHFENVENGVDDNISDEEAAALEKELAKLPKQDEPTID